VFAGFLLLLYRFNAFGCLFVKAQTVGMLAKLRFRLSINKRLMWGVCIDLSIYFRN